MWAEASVQCTALTSQVLFEQAEKDYWVSLTPTCAQHSHANTSCLSLTLRMHTHSAPVFLSPRLVSRALDPGLPPQHSSTGTGRPFRGHASLPGMVARLPWAAASGGRHNRGVLPAVDRGLAVPAHQRGCGRRRRGCRESGSDVLRIRGVEL